MNETGKTYNTGKMRNPYEMGNGKLRFRLEENIKMNLKGPITLIYK
jgi:hypothetical protein